MFRIRVLIVALAVLSLFSNSISRASIIAFEMGACFLMEDAGELSSRRLSLLKPTSLVRTFQKT